MLIPNLGFGGAQRVFHDHSLLLAARHNVTEIMFNESDGHAFPTGNEILSLEVAGGGGPIAKLVHFVQRVRRLSAIKRRLRPGLTISHLEGADYVNVFAGGGGKTVLCIHGSKLHDANIVGLLGTIRRRILIPWLYNRADAIVTVSHEIAIELAAMGVRQDKLRTIHNFFDPPAIRQRSMEPLATQEAAIYGGPPVLVTSGRLTLQKNQAPLLDILAALLRRRPARLLILGDGELRQPLIDRAIALGLRVAERPDAEADVLFLGFQDNPFRFLRHARCFVLSSGWEGFPMVLGEAMACGLPIVAADCPTGPREFIAPATIGVAIRPLRAAERGPFGRLLPIPDSADRSTIDVWVNELDDLLDQEQDLEAMSAESIARAEVFSLQKIGPQWTALVERLIAGAAPFSPPGTLSSQD